jgi:pimeloyl-ACP methyl ester carboxylesterase
VEALDLRDITMAGFSMGGAITMRYMGRHFGERVSKVAFLGAAAPCFTQRDDFPYNLPKSAVDGFIEACYSDRAQLLVDFGKIFFLAEDSVSPKLGDWFHSLGMEASPHATAMCLVELRDADCRGDMSKIRVPTGIFHGTQDKICSFALAEAMHRGTPGSRIIRFEQSGHGLVVDETEKFNRDLMDFVG